MESSPLLLVLLPFAGSAIALVGKFATAKKLFAAVSVSLLGAALVVLILSGPDIWAGGSLVYQLGGWAEPFGISFHLDGFAWLSSLLVLVIGIFVSIAALSRPGYGPSFFFFLLLLIAGMEGVVLTGDLFNMFVSFEIVAISAYVLIAFDRTGAGVLASFKYLVLSSIGILFFLFGVLLVYRDFGTLALSQIASAVKATPLAGETRSIHLAVAALCVGIGVRTAFLPFHTWLPEAHAHAPHPISALLSGVLIKVSFFAMIRILIVFSAGYLHTLLMWIGAATALFAVVRALAQSDAKRLLAYHSISQMGYILAVYGAGGALATTAALSHAVNHALFKALLFLVVGTAVRMTGERDIFAMKRIGRRAPLIALAFLVGALSIAGLPPFNGFASKLLIAYSMKGSIAYWLIRATAVGTVASFIKLSRVFLPGRVEVEGPKGSRPALDRPGFLIHVPAIGLALLCLLTGIFPAQVADAIHHLTGASTASLPRYFTLDKIGESLIIAALGVGLYLLVMTSAAKRLAAKIRDVVPELRTVLMMFLFGLGGFALVAFL